MFGALFLPFSLISIRFRFWMAGFTKEFLGFVCAMYVFVCLHRLLNRMDGFLFFFSSCRNSILKSCSWLRQRRRKSGKSMRRRRSKLKFGRRCNYFDFFLIICLLQFHYSCFSVAWFVMVHNFQLLERSLSLFISIFLCYNLKRM